MSVTIVYLLNWGFALRGIMNGSLVVGNTQMEIEDGMKKKAQDEMDGVDKGEV